MLSWDEYIKQGSIRKTFPNKGVIKSLIQTSDNRIKTFSEISLNEQNSSIIFSNYYDALREICESIALLNGYKIYFHEAIGLFLREILKEDAIFAKFDKFRIIRNGVNYYGNAISLNEALQYIDDIKRIIDKLKLKHLKEFF